MFFKDANSFTYLVDKEAKQQDERQNFRTKIFLCFESQYFPLNLFFLLSNFVLQEVERWEEEGIYLTLIFVIDRNFTLSFDLE